MKNRILLILLTIPSLNCLAQIAFEKGYYINNSEEKIDCLIKNLEWANNPSGFEFKLTEASESQMATIKKVKEFGIKNGVKYCRKDVKIDRSSDILAEMSKVKKPVFEEEELFLKVLIEGKANLFSFKELDLIRYFYSTDSSEVEQLIFKTYLIERDKIGVNRAFKQQLWIGLQCSSISMDRADRLQYNENSLVKYFIDYNECKSEGFVNIHKKEKGDLFNLNIRPGINISSLSIRNSRTKYDDTKFDNQFGLRFGIETEFILPFYKNKWAIPLEPTFRYFKSQAEVLNRRDFLFTEEVPTETIKVDYTSIELPIGIRYYFFLSEVSKIFLNASAIFDFTFGGTIEFENQRELNITTRNNLAFGLGYKYNDRFSLEYRYQTSRDILGNYVYWISDYNSMAVIFGYTLF